MSRRLAIVLHTHLPYVEGFGTWPFGEEWLWEAIATSYLPLAAVLDDAPGQVTLSVTPVLADQLEAPGVGDRCLAFLRGMREETHRLDLEAHPEVEGPLRWSLARYRAAADRLEALGGDALAALRPHVAMTSSATHAVLPLLATDAGVARQVRTGLESGRRRFPGAEGGFWLPECAHEPQLDPLLRELGVRHAVVEVPGERGVLRWPDGPTAFALDRPLVDRVWGHDGYPSHPAYLDTHHHTTCRHLAWAVDGGAYDPARASAQARADADDFLRAVPEGHTTFAIDTELLGHFWAEGADWLAAVLDQAEAAGVRIEPLAAYDGPVASVTEPAVTTWGHPPTLQTWSGPAAQGVAWTQRRLELAVEAARGDADERAVRELLALQSSDWAFLATHGTAGPYPLERAAGHADGVREALARPGSLAPAVRRLAPVL